MEGFLVLYDGLGPVGFCAPSDDIRLDLIKLTNTSIRYIKSEGTSDLDLSNCLNNTGMFFSTLYFFNKPSKFLTSFTKF